MLSATVDEEIPSLGTGSQPRARTHPNSTSPFQSPHTSCCRPPSPRGVGSPRPGLPTPKPPTLKQVPGSSSHCRLGGDAAAVPGLRPPVLCGASSQHVLGVALPPSSGCQPPRTPGSLGGHEAVRHPNSLAPTRALEQGHRRGGFSSRGIRTGPPLHHLGWIHATSRQPGLEAGGGHKERRLPPGHGERPPLSPPTASQCCPSGPESRVQPSPRDWGCHQLRLEARRV